MSDQEQDEVLRDLKMAEENLASIIKRLFKIYGATGVVLPVPPRPKLDVVAKLFNAVLLVAEVESSSPRQGAHDQGEELVAVSR